MTESLGSIWQINADELNIGYAEVGPQSGPPVILLHGWPYDICSYVDVAPLLASRGYRVLVPYLRGFGTTTFRSAATFRNGEQAIFAVDTIGFMDALKIESAILGGFDWGGRAAEIAAVLWPERIRGLVSVSGYTIINLADNQRPLLPKDEHGWWYQYYFATERGRLGYAENRYDFNKLIWQLASPKWPFSDAIYDRTAQSFQNPDHVELVIHNYRWRLQLAEGDPRLAGINAKLQEHPIISVPTITIGSDFDGANISGTGYRERFSGPYQHRMLPGIGHNVPQEAPLAFSEAIHDVERL